MIFRLFIAFIPLFAGFWIATQKLAELVQYTFLLGEPFMVSKGIPYYLPHNYFIWFVNFHEYIPQLFAKTYPYIFVSFVISFLLLFLLQKKKPLTSHGSARFGEYNDLLKMDLISASGVVIGQYDGKLLRLFTAFLRAFETIKKEKEAYAEMAFDDKVTRKKEVYSHKLERLYEKLNDSNDEKEIEKLKYLEKVLKEKIDAPVKYDAKKEDKFTVYPYIFLYKKLSKFYAGCKHFYLRDNSNKHLAVIAPTRSGKGVGLIIPTLLGSWTSSVIVNDIKSENWGITAGYRKRMGQTVIKFEPTAEDGSSARWNPLDEIKIGTASEVSMSQNLGMIIADYEGKGKMDHWGQNAANVISLVMLHMKYAHFSDPENYPNEPNLYTVAAFLKANMLPVFDDDGKPVMIYVDDDGNVYDEPTSGTIQQQKVDVKGFLDTLKNLQNFEHVPDNGIDIVEWDTKELKYVKKHFTPEDLKNLYPDATSLNYMPNTHPIIYQGFLEILSKAEQECASIISTANTALKEYLDPVLAQNTAVSDFCIDDMMNYKKPVSLYLVTPPSDILRLAPIFRLFFEMMVRHHAKRIGVYKKGRAKNVYKHKCLFLMDEFSSLGNLQSFAATLSYIAGYGMKVFLINQGLPQINGIYGKDNQILMNCHLQIFYAPNDNDTGKYAESLLGNKTIMIQSTSDSGLLTKKTYSKSATGRALMTADEIKRLGDKEIIVASGNPPIMTEKVKYYESNYFLNKLLDAPIVSDVIRNNPYPKRDKLIGASKINTNIEFDFTYKE